MHRIVLVFNKSQQDAFLPHVESGLFTFIGATTENPSFEVNSALLSRASVYVLKSLADEDLGVLVDRACERELGDPRYLARRIIRMASEDIGLADPRALRLALDAAEVYERLGSPEGELALAEAVVYLACAAKSNAVYNAYNAARAFIAKDKTRPVPEHLRNAPTKLMKELGYGKLYRYAHDEPDAYAAGETYLPEGMREPGWYQPMPRGLEGKIGDKLAWLRSLDEAAGKSGKK